MNSDGELLSSELPSEEETSEVVESPITSEDIPEETPEEGKESIEENTENVEETSETSTEVIYQVADLTKVENSLGIITCFVIFFSVYFLGSMVYRLVKDIFY